MTVGIPGTGLGGLFYFLLVALMPFCEVVHTLRGRSSLERWSRVGFHLLVLAAMLSVLWGEAWILDHALGALRSHFGSIGQEPVRDMFLEAGQFAALSSAGVLAALLAGVAALRFTPLCADRPAAQSAEVVFDELPLLAPSDHRCGGATSRTTAPLLSLRTRSANRSMSDAPPVTEA